ncbi:MAG: hypothetical protein DI539_23980 [Flavobacterium psychrophilum]|nr:MAG: hypothetical protein DI539_23980 [Flavobacterium psychrophilum]
MKSIIVLIICSIFLSSSYSVKSVKSEEEIKQIIIRKYEQMRATLKSGDPSYVLNMHTQDATLYQQNGKEVVGMVALKPFYEKIATMGIDIKSTPTTVEVLTADIVYEVGTFTSTTKTGIQNSAKYINIWKKVNGDWKIYKAIDQSKL